MKTLKNKPQLLLRTLLMTAFILTVFSGLSDELRAETYGQRLKYDLKRGAKNILSSPLEIAVGFQEYHERSGWPVVRQTGGMLVGAGRGILRLGSGVVDLGAAWIPGIQGGLPPNPEVLF